MLTKIEIIADKLGLTDPDTAASAIQFAVELVVRFF